MIRLMPRETVPPLDLPLVGGSRFVLAESKAETFSLLLFYRGYHCPLCRNQLSELKARIDKLAGLGVEAVAISMDSEERAERTYEEWDLGAVRLAYGLSEDTARAYGLYISSAISDKEPELFSEPGLFLVKPDSTLYFASVQTMPFTRPPLDELIMGIKYHREHGYPPRGVVAEREMT